MTFIDLNIQHIEENELSVLIMTKQGHITIHAYPSLSYAAVDVYVCSTEATPEKAIKTIKKILKPEKTKTTYLRRGDFGTITDMKPRIKTSLAPFRRIRNTGAKMIKFINKKQP